LYAREVRIAGGQRAGRGTLRTRTTAATNKVESYNHFVSWCRFGNRGIIAGTDPDEQEKVIKFATLLANCVIFRTVVDMTAVIRSLIAEGWTITAEDLAILSPYLTAHIQRFGEATDEVTLAPGAYDAHLDVGESVTSIARGLTYKAAGGQERTVSRRAPLQRLSRP